MDGKHLITSERSHSMCALRFAERNTANFTRVIESKCENTLRERKMKNFSTLSVQLTLRTEMFIIAYWTAMSVLTLVQECMSWQVKMEASRRFKSYQAWEQKTSLLSLLSNKICTMPWVNTFALWIVSNTVILLLLQNQPTLFIIDNGYCIYLWQGWWPKVEDIVDQDEVDSKNVDNRAGENRWYLERCEAMQTTIDYWREKCGNDETYLKESYMITAGFEPVEFQTIFPEWIVNEQVVEMNSLVWPIEIRYIFIFTLSE